MSVSINDKRRKGERITGLDLSNGAWFAILDLPGMEKFVDTAHTNDPLNVTPAKAKKMAKIVQEWTPPDNWGSPCKEHRAQLKKWLVDFLLNCNGFRTH